MSITERQRLIADMEAQSRIINRELRRLQHEGEMATAAIHAMRARAEQAMILNQVNESGSSNAYQSYDRINYDHTKATEKRRQAEQFVEVSQLTKDEHMIRSHLFPQCQLRQPHQQINSVNCSNQPHSEFGTYMMAKRNEEEDIQERTHSGPLNCQNTSIELTGLRNRQCALANKIATLQLARAQLLHNLARLDSTDVPSLNVVPTEDGLRNESTNYEYLHKSESAKGDRSGILALKSMDSSSHKPAQSNEASNKGYATSTADATTGVSVNDSECQTDFPVNFCSNPIYEYLSAFTQTAEPISAYLCQKDQQKANATQHDLVVAADKPSGTSISTLAAVAAVAAATFLTQTMNIQSTGKSHVKAVSNHLPARSDSDGTAKYTPDILFRMMSESQKDLNPDSQRLIANESRSHHSGDSEILDMKSETMASSSSQSRLPAENSNRIACYLLDPNMQLNQNYSRLRTSDLIAPGTAPDRLNFVSSTPANSSRPRSDILTKFSQTQSPPAQLLDQKEHVPPTEISKSFTCDSHGERRSRFSERIQIARIAVDERAKMNKTPSQFNTHYSNNVVSNKPLDGTSNESALRSASLRCLMRAEISTDNKLQRESLFIKSGLNEPTQNQHRHIANRSEYIDKKRNMESASVQVSSPTTKPSFQDPVDSSGLDIDSPSEIDTSVHSDDAVNDNRQNMPATYDPVLAERQMARFKIVQPKGVLVSESPDVRRQRRLEKNNGSQRTVVWMDELYGDSSSGCCTRKCDSMTELHEPNSIRRKTHAHCTNVLRQKNPSGMECTPQQTHLEHRSMVNGSCDKFANNQRCTSLTPSLLQKTQTTPSGHRSLPDPANTKRFSMS